MIIKLYTKDLADKMWNSPGSLMPENVNPNAAKLTLSLHNSSYSYSHEHNYSAIQASDVTTENHKELALTKPKWAVNYKNQELLPAETANFQWKKLTAHDVRYAILRFRSDVPGHPLNNILFCCFDLENPIDIVNQTITIVPPYFGDPQSRPYIARDLTPFTNEKNVGAFGYPNNLYFASYANTLVYIFTVLSSLNISIGLYLANDVECTYPGYARKTVTLKPEVSYTAEKVILDFNGQTESYTWNAVTQEAKQVIVVFNFFNQQEYFYRLTYITEPCIGKQVKATITGGTIVEMAYKKTTTRNLEPDHDIKLQQL